MVPRGWPWPRVILLATLFWMRWDPALAASCGPPGPAYSLDLLVAYTPAALADMGTTAALDAALDAKLAFLNQALRNNGIDAAFREVYRAGVTYVESGSFGTDLARLENPSDGFLDQVPVWRDSYGADFVCLFEHSTGSTGGIASLDCCDPNLPYSVVGVNMPDEAMAHEVGHNLGCGHELPEVGCTAGSSAFSFTLNFLTYKTIMNSALGGFLDVDMPLFSAPDSTYEGVTVGDGNRNNAQRIKDSLVCASAYRPSGSPNVAPAVTVLSPAGGSIFTALASVTVQASASDSDGTIRQVDFFQDGLLMGSDLSSPYALVLGPLPAGTHILTAEAIDNLAQRGTSCAVTIQVDATLPPPWLEQDIWEPAQSGMWGSAGFAAGTYTVFGSGDGLGINASEFHFVYQPFCGDGYISAYVNNISGVDGYASGSVMFRSDLSPGASCELMGISLSNGRIETYRDTPWTPVTTITSGSQTKSWVRIVRTGDVFEAFVSNNGSTWSAFSSPRTIVMPDPVLAGFAVFSDDRNVLAGATFDSVALSGTACASATATETRTATLTPTAADSFTATGTGTPSRTASFTLTDSASPTETRVASLTATPTPSPAMTPTDSMTPTFSQTASGSLTVSLTGTATPSRTLSVTASDSPSPTETKVSSPTLSGTRTATASPTRSVSASFTATPSLTATPSPSAASSATPMQTASFTRTRSSTATGSSTPTASPIPGAAQIIRAAIVPNPVQGSSPILLLQWSGNAGKITVKIFTASGRRVGFWEALNPPMGPALYPLQMNLANGIYHFRVAIETGGGEESSKAGTFFVLR